MSANEEIKACLTFCFSIPPKKVFPLVAHLIYCVTKVKEGEMTHVFNIYRLNSSTKVQQESSGLRVYTVDPAVISVYHSKTEQMQNK